MTDLSRMDLEEIRNRLYDLAILMRSDTKSSFAAAELDEKFKLHYGSYVPITNYGFGCLSALLEGTRWFCHPTDDPSRFACVKRENYKFAYKIPNNPKQGKIHWLQHIKEEIKQEPEEIPPPASPDPSPSPTASPPREITEVTHDVQMSVGGVLDAQRSNAPQGAVSVSRARSGRIVAPVEVKEEVCDASYPQPKSSVTVHRTLVVPIPPSAPMRELSPVVPFSFPPFSPTPMHELDVVTETLFKKLYNDQIAAVPHLRGPVPSHLYLNNQEQKLVDTVGGILKTLGGRARFDELEMEYRKQEGDSFAEMCTKYLSSDMGPFNVLRLMSSGKIEPEILGPRMVYFCLKHPIDLLIDGVLEYLRLHGGKGDLGAVNAWFKEHYVEDLCTRCSELFGDRYLTTFREFVILSRKFVMEFERGQWHFGLTGEDWSSDLTSAVSSTLSVIDVLIDRILECLMRFDGMMSLQTLLWLYEEEIYKHPFDLLVFHAFGSYHELASVAHSKKKFTINFEGEAWVFKLIEDVEETTNVIGKKPPTAVLHPTSAPKSILGTKMFLLNRRNAAPLASTKSKLSLSLRNSNILPLLSQKKTLGDVDMGPSRFCNKPCSKIPRALSIPSVLSVSQKNFVAMSSGNPRVLRARSVRSVLPVEVKEEVSDATNPKPIFSVHPIDLLIDGVFEYLRLHGGMGDLGAVNAWFKTHYMEDLCTQCSKLFGDRYLTTFREFVILSRKFVMEFERGRCYFGLTGEDWTAAASSTSSVVDVLINRILVCLVRLGGRTSFGTLATLYEEIYKHPFDPLITHAFGPYQELASVANSKKKFTLNLEGETWVFKLIEDVDSTPMDVEETTNAIGKSPSDAVLQSTSAPKPIPGTKLPSLMELDCSNAAGLASIKSKPQFSLSKISIPLFPQKVAAGDVDVGPSRFGDNPCPKIPRALSVPSVIPFSCTQENSIAKSSREPRVSRARSVRVVVPVEVKKKVGDATDPQPKCSVSSSIAKPSPTAPNPPQSSSSAHEKSSTETIPPLCVDIDPRVGDCPFSKVVTTRLIACLLNVPDYRITVGELNALYKKTYAKELDLDLMSAFGSIDLRGIKYHSDMRGKIDIWESKSKGWMYRLERSQRPESSHSRDRHRRASPVVGRDSRQRSRRSPSVSRSHRSSPHHRKSRSRSRRRSRSHESSSIAKPPLPTPNPPKSSSAQEDSFTDTIPHQCVDIGPSRVSDDSFSTIPRALSVRSVLPFSRAQEHSIAKSSGEPKVSRARSVRIGVPLEVREQLIDATNPNPKSNVSSSIAKPSLPTPNPPQSSSAHEESSTETVPKYIGPSRVGDNVFSKVIAIRLMSCLHKAPNYQMTVREMNTLYQKTYASKLVVDLMAAFATVKLKQLRFHRNLRGKVDILQYKNKGWIYRLERSQRSSIAKPPLPAPNSPQSSSANEDSSTKTVPAYFTSNDFFPLPYGNPIVNFKDTVNASDDVDIGPSGIGDYSFPKLVVDRLLYCLRSTLDYRLTVGEMATLYKKHHNRDLGADLMAAFRTIDIRRIKSHKDLRGKIDIWNHTYRGWMYHLAGDMIPRNSRDRSRDRHRRDSPVVRRISTERSRRSSSSSRHRRSSPHHRRSRSRSPSRERRPRSKRSPSPRKCGRPRSRQRSPSSDKHEHLRRGRTVTPSPSPDSSKDRPLFKKAKKDESSVAPDVEVEVGSSKGMKKKPLN